MSTLLLAPNQVLHVPNSYPFREGCSLFQNRAEVRENTTPDVISLKEYIVRVTVA